LYRKNGIANSKNADYWNLQLDFSLPPMVDDWGEADAVVSSSLQFSLSSHPIPRPRLSNCPDPQSLSSRDYRRRPWSLFGEGKLGQRSPEFALTSNRSGKNALVIGARLRDRLAAGCASSSRVSNLNDSAHVVQAADDGRMHALVFDKVTHRVVSGKNLRAIA
jgi:hypothetical protein